MSSTPPKFPVLVFGATGEVGSAVALEAASRGAIVTTASRDITKPNPYITPAQEQASSLRRVTADLADPAAVTRAVRQTGARAVFIYSVRAGPETTRASLAALRDAGVQHVVFLSTSQVRTAGKVKGDIRTIPHEHAIPWQHAQVEIALEELGIRHTAVRAGFFASNPLRIYLDATVEPKRVNLLAPEVKHDPIDPADIGRVAGALLVNPVEGTGTKHVVYLSGPELLSQTEQWEIINRTLRDMGKQEVEVRHITVEQYLDNLAKIHVPEVVARSLAKSMLETRGLYAKEDYESDRENVEVYSGRKPTRFENFVRREISRYFK